MRTSKTLLKLRNNEPARVTVLGHYMPFFVRHAAHTRYDCIWIDLEHRSMPEREVQALMAFCHLNDIDCMIRPALTARTHLTRYLEDGATGLMIPFVNTAEFARQIVHDVKFPPAGERGIDGAGLDSDYTLHHSAPAAEYAVAANRETFVVAQIETPEAVLNVESIAAVPGIDVLFVGPNDLGLRLRETPCGTVENIDQAIIEVARAARTHGKAWGTICGSPGDMERYMKMGAQMLPWRGDFRILLNGLNDCSRELDQFATHYHHTEI